MADNKIIYLLIGPKGSGKTFIGSLFNQYGVEFVRVEDWAKEVKGSRDVTDKSYIDEIFRLIEELLTEKMHQTDRIVFESTGLTDSFDRMLENLQQKFRMVLIKVEVDGSLCLDRVKTRDQSIHVNVSDEQVNMTNSLVRQKKFDFDYVINNNNFSKEELLSKIGIIVGNSAQH